MILSIRLSTSILLAFWLLGCASPQGPQSAGKLEVTVPGMSADRVKTALVSEMQKRKFRIANETQSIMSFEQPASGAVLQSVSDADVGKTPIERVTYTIKPVASDVLVSAEISVIGKAASSPQRKIDISQSAEAQNVQSVLDKIAGQGTK